jgi:FkbM family methyltransferase
MFNNCDYNTNGEYSFYNFFIKDSASVIFDVGSRNDTVFNTFEREVHYFEPDDTTLNQLKLISHKNNKAYYNNFGLGNSNCILPYYSNRQSFIKRDVSLPNETHIADKEFIIKRASEYIINNKISNIDFLKIDTEGYEYEVIKGFDDSIKIVKIIQFEYGGTFMDSGISLENIINYLESNGFHSFSYLVNNGLSQITDKNDHYQYCNIICFNIKFFSKDFINSLK